MNAYSYDENGIYVRECTCQRDPVRSAKEGHDCYLMPANATETAPPAFDPDTQLCTWNGEVWIVTDKPEPPAPEERPEPAPTELERLRADVDFLMVMGGYEG